MANKTLTNDHKPVTSPIGFHYFPDTLHYREQDLEIWLPELHALGASWVTLSASTERAIPEFFINALIAANISPILQYPITGVNFSNGQSDIAHDLELLLNNYAKWGVRYVALFDSPNLRRFWPPSQWTQEDLVERFMDNFLPCAVMAIRAGITPVLPPLEPGGDYWDTAFLQSTLRSLQRRNATLVIDSLAIGANARTFDRPIDWGAGGPERWPGAQPYHTPLDSQDQIGFHIFDWYLAITRAELGAARPIILLQAGCRPTDCVVRDSQEQVVSRQEQSRVDYRLHAEKNMMLPGEIPEEVIAMNYWLLCAEKTSPYVESAWYQPDGKTLPVVNAMKQFVARKAMPFIAQAMPCIAQEMFPKTTPTSQTTPAPWKKFRETGPEILNQLPFHPIDHYLLLPLYAWGVADWDLEAIRPFVQEFHPTVGFSIHEACLAARVTIYCRQSPDDSNFSESPAISPEALQMLRDSGCQVEQYHEGGILLAI